MNNLITSVPELQLLVPYPERDAPDAAAWLEGEVGRATLMLMGNPEDKITETNIEAEKARLQDFLNMAERGEQLTWMMQLEGKTIGAVWIELVQKGNVPPPAVHIMIGDASSRGRGIGKATIETIIDYLRKETDYTNVYSRHLVTNSRATALLEECGFTKINEPYAEDGLMFQNEVAELKR